ncbi:MAG: M1 family metallopeptidase [Bacteroidia bacterium]
MFKQINLPKAKYFYVLLLILLSIKSAYGDCGICKKSAVIKKETSGQKVSSGFDVSFYSLRLTINFTDSSIAGENSIVFTAVRDLDSISINLFSHYKIGEIIYEERNIPYKHKGNKIHIYFPEKILRGNKATIKIKYAGKPPVAVKPPWEGGFVWAKDSLKRPWAAVACEQLGASSWWPCKDDLSDEPDSVDLAFYVPKGMFCVSNGQLVNISQENENFTSYHWRVSYPINIYNITLNIGYYQHFTDNFTSEHKDANGRNITYPVDYYFLDYNINKAKAFFADTIYARTKNMLKIFEKRFGVYPFYRDGYALVETPYWGMEHQGAVAYGNNFKLNFYGFDFILVHESGHEWWGNAVSCKDAGDMWIHESFTTYAEALYVEYTVGYQKSINYLLMQKPNIENVNPVQGPRNINFHARTDNDIYYKGSWMLHTLRSVLNNDSLWFGMLYGLQKEYQYKTIATEDVITYMEKYSGKNLKPFFAQYLYETRLPVLQFLVQNNKGKSRLKYRWFGTVDGFNMPVEVEVKGKKYLLNPTNRFQKLELESKAKDGDIKVDTGRFLVEVLNGI